MPLQFLPLRAEHPGMHHPFSTGFNLVVLFSTRTAQLSLALGCLLAVLLMPRSALAADIHVDGNTASDCSLVHAIVAANTDAPSGGCPAGQPGHDTIRLPLASSLYFDTGPYGDTTDRAALPPITSPITIVGNHTLLAREPTLPCPSAHDLENFRLLHIEASGKLTLTQVTLQGGCGVEQGGGVRNLGGRITIIDSVLQRNQANFAGGGLSNEAGGSARLIDTQIEQSDALRGAGLNNIDDAYLELESSRVAQNSALTTGGGLLTVGATTLLSATQISQNLAPNGGGLAAISHHEHATVITLTHGISVTHNQAAIKGGGLYMDRSLGTIHASVFNHNQAQEGGAIHLTAGRLQLAHSELNANWASSRGGAIVTNQDAELTIRHSALVSNTAVSHAGILALNGAIHITESRLSANGPGALVRSGGQVQLLNSCVQKNLPPALANIDRSAQQSSDDLFTQNVWWNAINGPGGEGPGTGDAIGMGVAYVPFVATPWDYCEPVGSDLRTEWAITEAPPWLPGQPITLTLAVSNAGPDDAQEILIDIAHMNGESALADPYGWNLDPGALTPTTGGWMLANLAAGASHVLTATAVAQSTLTQPVSSTITGTVTYPGFDADLENNTASMSLAIVPPTIQFATTQLEAIEGNSPLSITVTLTPTNPFTTATVNVATDTEADPATATTLATANPINIDGEIAEQLSFAAGQVAHTLLLANVDNDVADGARSFTLALHSPIGAQIGPLNRLEIHILDDDVPGITQLETPTTLFEGGEAVWLRFMLSSRPLAAVQVTIHRQGECGAPVSLEIQPEEWDMSHALPITAPHDFAVTGDRACRLELHFASDDPLYAFEIPYEFEFTVVDNDAATLALALHAPPAATAGTTIPITALVTNTGSIPLTGVQIHVHQDPHNEIVTREGELAPGKAWETVIMLAVDPALGGKTADVMAMVTGAGAVDVTATADTSITFPVHQATPPSPAADRLYIPFAAVSAPDEAQSR